MVIHTCSVPKLFQRMKQRHPFLSNTTRSVILHISELVIASILNRAITLGVRTELLYGLSFTEAEICHIQNCLSKPAFVS